MSATVTVDRGDLSYVTRLVLMCCPTCAVPYAMPERLQDQAREDSGRWFYCPNGHQAHYAESEADRLRARLRRAEEATAAERARTDQAKAAAKAARAETARVRRRAAAAVCPCCHRSFVQLRRHMNAKHPDYRPG